MANKKTSEENEAMNIQTNHWERGSNPLLNDVVDPNLPAEAQAAIGRQLRQVYDQMLSEPLPDRFAKLLDQLSKSGTK